jgi:hypothetical protein
VGSRAELDTDVKRKNPLASAGNRTSITQSVSRHYTDCATPAPPDTTTYLYDYSTYVSNQNAPLKPANSVEGEVTQEKITDVM